MSGVEEHTGRRVERWETLGQVETVEALAEGEPAGPKR